MLTTLTDSQLLLRHVQHRDDDAFAELVRRHINMVYIAARRQVGTEAEDVTQAVFLLLAQKAPTLHTRVPLIAWLYAVTSRCCSNLLKTQRNRKKRERSAASNEELTMPTDPSEAATCLDAGLSALRPRERQVLLLHFFQNQSFADAARTLGISEDAARKRSQRGLERLRHFFHKRGFALAIGGVSALLLQESAKAAPSILAASVSAAAATGTTAAKAALLAKQTAATMSTVSWKPLAAVLVLAATGATSITVLPYLRTHASTPKSTIAAITPAEPADESKAPGDLCIAVADLLIDADAADALRKISQPVPSDATFYTLHRATASDLHATLKDLLSGDLHILSIRNEIYRAPLRAPDQPANSLRFADNPVGTLGPMNLPEFTRDQLNINAAVYLRGNTQCADGQPMPYLNTTLDGHSARLNFQFEDVVARLTINPVNSPPPRQQTPDKLLTKSASLHWSGSLDPGQSLLLTGDFGEWKNQHVLHLQIIEAYNATAMERRFFQLWKPARNSDSRNQLAARLWASDGQPALRRIIDSAILFTSKTTAAPPPNEKWIRRLSDGSEVQLLGLSSPNNWPLCRWDPQGQPTLFQNIDSIAQTGQSFLAAIRLPVAYGDTNVVDVAPEEPDRLTLYVGAGKWTPHDCDEKGTVIINNQPFSLSSRAMSSNTACTVWLNGPSPLESEMRIAARTKDNRLIEGRTTGGDNPLASLARTLSNPAAGNTVDRMFNVPSTQIDHFVLLTRPREKIVFEGFASTPALDPPTGISPQDLLTAEARLTDILRTQCIADRTAVYQQLASLPRDPATPQGAMRILLDKAFAGDVAGVREFLTGQDDRVTAAATALATRYHAIDLCIKKFGVAALQQAYPDNDFDTADGAIAALPERFLVRKWFVEDDRASFVSFVTLIHQGNTWKFDLDRFYEQRRTKPDFEQSTRDTAQFLKDFESGKITTPDQAVQGLHLPYPLLY